MDCDAVLDEIASGDKDPASAKPIILGCLNSNRADAPGRVYDSLRTLVWHMLIERRLDGELRGWFDVIRQAGAVLEMSGREEAHLLRPLSDLVGDTIGFADANRLVDVTKRAHVQEILSSMAERARDVDGPMSRKAIVHSTGLRDANLSRILRTLTVHGFVERSAEGRSAAFALTRQGRAACAEFANGSQDREAVRAAWVGAFSTKRLSDGGGKTASKSAGSPHAGLEVVWPQRAEDLPTSCYRIVDKSGSVKAGGGAGSPRGRRVDKSKGLLGRRRQSEKFAHLTGTREFSRDR